MSGFVCSSPVYRYKGYIFEVHNFCGPCQIDEDYEPIENMTDEFFEMVTEFMSLPNNEKEKFKVVSGGCQRI